MKHYKLAEFSLNIQCQPPLNKRKGPLLMTFWWRFCCIQNFRATTDTFVTSYCWSNRVDWIFNENG